MRWLLGLTLLFASFRGLADQVQLQIPFEMRGGLIFVSVESTNSTIALSFVLDSGAGVSVLNLQMAHKLGLSLAQPAVVRGVQSQTKGYWPQHLSAKLAGVPLPRNYLAVDLSELSKACMCDVDGLLGADFFWRKIIQIDYRAKAIRILPSFEAPRGVEGIALKKGPQSILTRLRVNARKPEWFRVDTGCASELEWVCSGRISGGLPKQVAVGLSMFSKGEMTTSLEMGKLQLETVHTGVHASPIFQGEAGLLGNGLLSKFHKVTFDCSGSKVYVEP
jgi:hypothetical protein